MANKTQPTKESVTKFLAAIKEPVQRADAKALCEIMKKATGEKPVLWGTAIVGFGNYQYKSERTGRGGDWFNVGFAARKGSLTLYLMDIFRASKPLLPKLGIHKVAGSCIHIKSLKDVDGSVLAKLIRTSYMWVKENGHPHAAA